MGRLFLVSTYFIYIFARKFLTLNINNVQNCYENMFFYAFCSYNAACDFSLLWMYR